MSKEYFWNQHSSWQEATQAWDEGANKQKEANPLKVLQTLPKMPGMTEETAKNLKWKSLKWMIAKDHEWKIAKHILKRPFHYAAKYIKSLFKKKSFVRDGDFFLY